MTTTLDPSRWARPADLAATTLTDALLPMPALFAAATGWEDMIELTGPRAPFSAVPVAPPEGAA